MLKYRKVTRLGIEPRTFWTYTRCSNQLSYPALEINQLILYLCNCQSKDTYSARHIQCHSLHARSTLWPWHDQISQSGNHVTDYIIQFQQYITYFYLVYTVGFEKKNENDTRQSFNIHMVITKQIASQFIKAHGYKQLIHIRQCLCKILPQPFTVENMALLTCTFSILLDSMTWSHMQPSRKAHLQHIVQSTFRFHCRLTKAAMIRFSCWVSVGIGLCNLSHGFQID